MAMALIMTFCIICPDEYYSQEKVSPLKDGAKRQTCRPLAECPQLPQLVFWLPGPFCSSMVAMASQSCRHLRLDWFCSSATDNNDFCGWLDQVEILKSSSSFPVFMNRSGPQRPLPLVLSSSFILLFSFVDCFWWCGCLWCVICWLS